MSFGAMQNAAVSAAFVIVIPGRLERAEPGISRFRVRCFASPRNDESYNYQLAAAAGMSRCRFMTILLSAPR